MPRSKKASAAAGKKRKAEVLEAEPDWVIECPAKPEPKQSRGVRDTFIDRDHPGVESLAIQYKIQPGSKWSSLRSYTNVKYQGEAFSPRDHIFVNKTHPPPQPPPQDAPPEEVLKYTRDNMWIGRIQQAKADNTQEVWIRVFWLYWPEELPMGAQHYHGQSELILSNYTDIIDATTISGRAEISEWDENKDGDEDKNLSALYWRQTLDVSQLGPKSRGGLSTLRKHCVCRKEYNPDSVMFKCPHVPDCGIWNHVECLEDDLRRDLEARLEKRSLQGYLDRRASAYTEEVQKKQKSIGNTIAVGIANAASSIIHGTMHVIEGNSPEPDYDTSFDAAQALLEPPKTIGKKGKAMTNSRLQIAISNAHSSTDAGNITVVAKIKLLPAAKGETEMKGWTIKLDCLRCAEPLD